MSAENQPEKKLVNTRPKNPVSVSRTLTHRIIVDFNAHGSFRLSDADGGRDLIDGVNVMVGDCVTATFTADSVADSIAAFVQPSGWSTECVGESSAVLGNVDFPFLGESGYAPYPQAARSNKIQVSFERDGSDHATITMIVQDDAAQGSRHTYAIGVGPFGPNAYRVAFVSFTEVSSSQSRTAPTGVAANLVFAAPATSAWPSHLPDSFRFEAGAP